MRSNEKIIMKELNKEEWLSEIPELIYKLKSNYNFYFSGYYANINRDILDIVNRNKDKHKHKISVYKRNNRFFVVVYRKYSPDIYYTNEYKEDKNDNRIRYFMTKFKRVYKKAEVEYEKQVIRESYNNSTI